MDSNQLACGLQFLNCQHDNLFHTEVYAADEIPQLITEPSVFIVNTDIRGKPGTHWVCFFIPKIEKIEFFDSYGFHPFINAHLEFLTDKKWICNEKEMQSLTSNVCGQYCLLYAACRMNGYSTKDFQSVFTKDLYKNDAIVEFIATNKFKHVLLDTCKHTKNQTCCAKNCN